MRGFAPCVVRRPAQSAGVPLKRPYTCKAAFGEEQEGQFSQQKGCEQSPATQCRRLYSHPWSWSSSIGGRCTRAKRGSRARLAPIGRDHEVPFRRALFFLVVFAAGRCIVFESDSVAFIGSGTTRLIIGSLDFGVSSPESSSGVVAALA